MKYDIFIPVRLDSERLPKKAIKKIDEKPIIKYLLERLQTIKKINDVIVCTTSQNSDDELITFLEKEKISYYRGNEKDILQRFFDSAKKFESEFIIAVDGDDIYCDPDIVEKIIETFERTDADYIKVEGVPVGFTPIGFKKSMLKEICKFKKTTNTETGYGQFFDNQKDVNVKKVIVSTKIDFPKNLRMSLDYEEDFLLAKKIFKKLGNSFHVDDVLKFLSDNPIILEELNDLQKKWENHWNANLADTSVRDN